MSTRVYRCFLKSAFEVSLRLMNNTRLVICFQTETYYFVSYGKLGIIVEQANINEVRYACSVHMYQCINEL